jgi:ABC-type dipeptide/oligopeptide/nickel transport system permease subunit
MVESTSKMVATELSTYEFDQLEERNIWRDAFARMRRNRLAMVGLAIAVILIIVAIIGPFISPYGFNETNITQIEARPSASHWLGTDQLGRDLLSRILWGARTAVLVATLTTVLTTLLGVVLGSLAAYLGGWVDALISRVIDVLMSFPNLLLAIFVNATVKAPVQRFLEGLAAVTGLRFLADTVTIDYIIVFGALSIVSWPGMARLIRGQILSLRARDYIMAAEALGIGTKGILLRHLIPNALGPVVVTVTVGFGAAMLAESSLSYLGIGVQPPGASWGRMISDSLGRWRYAPHLVLAPGLTLATVIFAFNFLGDGLNDALNPRLR